MGPDSLLQIFIYCLLQILFTCKFKFKPLSIRSPNIICSVTIRTTKKVSVYIQVENTDTCIQWYFLRGKNRKTPLYLICTLDG